MLCLSRRSGESLVIGDVRVTILATSNGRVRLGIEAPKDVAVVRPEVRFDTTPLVETTIESTTL